MIRCAKRHSGKKEALKHNKNTQTRVDTQMIGTKKDTFQLEAKNRFTALEEHDDMDSLNKNMTEMIQQSAMSIANTNQESSRLR